MLIGILKTGNVNPDLAARHGQYQDMFAGLLGAADPELRFRTYDTVAGEIPASPTECDAWLITGSRHGVYDDLPWIEPLKAFLRAARAAGQPIIGICFGHQILAEALGGKAVKSEKGWGVGVHDYTVVRRPGWMAEAPERIAVHAMHQDQVIEVPEDATVLAASPFCEFAMLAYGDPEAPDAISIQPHPEFAADFARELLETRVGTVVPGEIAGPALASFGREVHDRDFARWCASFLRRMKERRAAA